MCRILPYGLAVLALCLATAAHAETILFGAIDRALTEEKPVTGENLRDAILKIKRFQGLVPVMFHSNTASVPFDLNVMRGGRDTSLVPPIGDGSRTAT